MPSFLQERMEELRFKMTPRVLLVCVDTQKMYFYEDGSLKSEFKISTALNGVGEQLNSNRTPRGWHRIKEKIGKDLPVGAVLRGREFTGEIWTEEQCENFKERDCVTSRILWLDGMEDGTNRGFTQEGLVVDSHQRYIYIHGTNHENLIGKPVSHGCVRMLNDDVIHLFEQVNEDDMVYITESLDSDS